MAVIWNINRDGDESNFHFVISLTLEGGNGKQFVALVNDLQTTVIPDHMEVLKRYKDAVPIIVAMKRQDAPTTTTRVSEFFGEQRQKESTWK